MNDPQNQQTSVTDLRLENLVRFLRHQKMQLSRPNESVVLVAYVEPSERDTFHWVRDMDGKLLLAHENQLTIVKG